MEKEYQPIQVNVRSVLCDKVPKLERFLPNFVIRYLEHILHQDDFNLVLREYGHLPGISLAKASLDHYGITATTLGLENVPLGGRHIFVSNHPLGGLDGLILIQTVGGLFGEVKFVVNDVLIHFTPFNDVFVPVNAYGKQNQEYAKTITQIYDSDTQILYFPAGICSRKIKGVVTDLPWKRNFLQKAIKHKRDVVPIYFSGQNSNFFYRLANIRKFFHIPFNIEMFFLADEMFCPKQTHFTLYFGKPIPYTHFTKDKSPDYWLSEIRANLYSLGKEKGVVNC